MKTCLITGISGFVGSHLAEHILTEHPDWRVAGTIRWRSRHDNIEHLEDKIDLYECDLRDPSAVERVVNEVKPERVFGLAAQSHVPTSWIAPKETIDNNVMSQLNLLEAIRQNGIKRFVYASSSSVYGIKEKSDVLEEDSCEPLTDYSKYKMMCEDELRRAGLDDLCTWIILRPATVCGYGSRLRLDLTVNILTIHALVNRRIRVFGGSQRRPNLHIQDMAEVYQVLLESPAEKIHRQVFNAGYQNLAVSAIADIVKQEVGQDCEIVVEPSDDPRSYHVNSDKIARVLGFKARHTIQDAVRGIAEAYQAGKIQNPLHNPLYFNIKRMKDIKLEQTVSHA